MTRAFFIWHEIEVSETELLAMRLDGDLRIHDGALFTLGMASCPETRMLQITRPSTTRRLALVGDWAFWVWFGGVAPTLTPEWVREHIARQSAAGRSPWPARVFAAQGVRTVAQCRVASATTTWVDSLLSTLRAGDAERGPSPRAAARLETALEALLSAHPNARNELYDPAFVRAAARHHRIPLAAVSEALDEWLIRSTPATRLPALSSR